MSVYVVKHNGDFIVTDSAMRVDGEKLIYRSDRELYSMEFSLNPYAEVYTPGNGQKVAEYFKKGNDTLIIQYQNSGDFRQLLNNRNRGKYFSEHLFSDWTCVEFGISASKFSDLMDICLNHNQSVLLDMITYNRGVIHFERYYNGSLFCVATVDIIRGWVVEIRTFDISADDISEVYKFFGSCKHTGNVHSVVFLNGNRIIFDNKAEMLDMTHKWYFYECIKGSNRGRLFNDINNIPKGTSLKKYKLHRDYNRYYVEPTCDIVTTLNS